MTNKLDVYVHVPKTGGVSLRQVVFDHYGPRKVYVYNQKPPTFIRADIHRRWHILPEDKRHVVARRFIDSIPQILTRGLLELGAFRYGISEEQATARATALIGHFSVNTLTVPENTRYFTVVREPLERMVSHYRHLQAMGTARANLVGWLEGQDRKLPFQEFALSEPLQNFQTRFVGNRLSRFEAVGVTANLGAFLLRVGLTQGYEPAPYVNQSVVPAPSLPTDSGFLREFHAFHRRDYMFYEAASSQMTPEARAL